ncbi:MAG: hypothetical protein Q9166_006789 [cf. Caloplaca sp. 2 TL-2023]
MPQLAKIVPNAYFFQILVFVVATALSTLAIWRLWRFTVSPWLHPEDPRELPYWIPFFGHARAFLSNQDRLLSYGRNYFENNREPFALTLGGEKLYILSSHADVVSAYKNNNTLDYGPVVGELTRNFGVSKESISKIFVPTEEFLHNTSAYNPHGKTFFRLKSDFYHVQLHPGPKFEATQAKFLDLLDEAMTFDRLPGSVSLRHCERVVSVSLYRLCQEVFVRAGTEVFFGKQFLDLDPHFIQSFIDFDDNNWMVFYGWPHRAAATAPMHKILAVIETYLDLAKTERAESTWLIDIFEDAQGHLNMPKRDIAVVLMMLLWVINTNAYRVTFWMLAYMLHSTSLRAAIRDETVLSMREDGSVNVSHLMRNSPRLDSVWFEILRLTNAASAVRTVTQPTRIGGKVLQPGHKVMSPFRQIHFNKDVFGESTDEFDPNRFLRDEKLAKHPSYKPFGGGLTKCPGRFVARQETYIFIALMLHRFESELSTKTQGMPRMELDTPTTGVISPKSGDDVSIHIRGTTLKPACDVVGGK